MPSEDLNEMPISTWPIYGQPSTTFEIVRIGWAPGVEAHDIVKFLACEGLVVDSTTITPVFGPDDKVGYAKDLLWYEALAIRVQPATGLTGRSRLTVAGSGWPAK